MPSKPGTVRFCRKAIRVCLVVALAGTTSPAWGGVAGWASLFGTPPALAGPILDHPYVLGEVMVRFHESTDPAEAEEVIRLAGAKEVEPRFTPDLYLAYTDPSEGSMLAFLLAVLENPAVLEALPNYLGEGGFVPNDPVYASQWHLEQPNDVDIDAAAAWDLSRGVGTTVVAILDSGIHFSHPELAGRIYTNLADPRNGVDDDGNGLVDDYNGWDFVESDDDPNPNPPDTGHPHGTWVSSALGANSSNSFQVSGVDHNAKILPLRVLDDNNAGTLADLLDALTYVVQRNDVDLVNLSLINYPPVEILGDAIEAAAQKSILVACAGNGGPGTADGQYPGAHPSTLSIGSTTDIDTLAPFSSTGSTVDFTAPGDGVGVADADPPFGGSESTVVSGCSFAAPIVAGIGGLLKARYPFLTATRLETALAVSAQDLGVPGRDPEFGWGRVNAKGALDYVIMAYEIFADGFEAGDTSGWDLTVP